jgi:hypothetical protein
MAVSKDFQNDINNLVIAIKRGVVIPIVGYDMLANESQPGTEKDFLKLLIRTHSENSDTKLEDLLATAHRSEDELTGYELTNMFYHNLPSKTERDNFRMALSETIEDKRFHFDLTPESFRKLVSIKHFTFFINATFTNILSLAYNAYRAKGNTEEEIKSSYDVLRYHPTEPDILPNSAPSKFVLDFKKPVIYNLFGTHDEARGDYLLTDADYIELIYDLIQDKNDKFKNLVSFLNKANLLFLGCNFPDWFFRFFIRICVGDRLDSASAIERKTVIDRINNLQLDSSRSVFLSYYKIQTLKMDCNTLIDEIYKNLSKDKDKATHIVEDQENNNIFISYCRDDEQVAKDVVVQLDDKYIDYFLDENALRTGDNLNNSISGAIDKCCVFLFIVSSNIQKSEKYLWEELRYAKARNKVIWPVYKEFVNKDMLLPAEFNVSDDLRELLNKNAKLGIVLANEPASSSELPNEEIGKRGNTIPQAKLREIKEAQFKCRTGEKKRP